MLKKIGFTILGVILLLVIVGFFLPAKYSAKRSIVIKAPVANVFDQVNDLQKWDAWSPWLAEDPSIKITYGEITKGKGASYRWTSEKSGEGSLTIEKSIENAAITTDLDFTDEGKAKGIWTFEETDGGTKVTWGINGDAGYNLINRYFGLMIDTFVGPYFDKGLAKLKEVAESIPQKEEDALTKKEN